VGVVVGMSSFMLSFISSRLVLSCVSFGLERRLLLR
jgi:hypothetical protein